MTIRVVAPELNKPTYETLKEYSSKKYKKIERILKKGHVKFSDVRVSVKKAGKVFSLTAELTGKYKIVVHSVNRDLRALIDSSIDLITRQINDVKEKLIMKHRGDKDLSIGASELFI